MDFITYKNFTPNWRLLHVQQHNDDKSIYSASKTATCNANSFKMFLNFGEVMVLPSRDPTTQRNNLSNIYKPYQGIIIMTLTAIISILFRFMKSTPAVKCGLKTSAKIISTHQLLQS